MGYGIYGIYYKDKLIYIGSSDNLDRRWKQHKTALEKGKHSNKALQKYFNTYVRDVNELGFRVIHKTLDASKIRLFFAEMICILNYRPTCNKAVFQIGFKYIGFGKPEVEFDKRILQYL